MSMEMRILLIFCTLTWAISATAHYAPRVTKSLIESPQNPGDRHVSALTSFGDSHTLMLTLEGLLHVSTDDGENWKTVNEIGQAVISSYVDQFHQERGFVTTRAEKIQEIHVTEDQGRSWRKLAIPREIEGKGTCYPRTHPFDNNMLLLNCNICNEGCCGTGIVYASNDAGKSFRHLIGAPCLRDFRTQCDFAPSSKESTLESNGIYCIHTIDKPTNPDVIDLNETPFQQENQSVGAIFYTTDLGRTKKVFNELKGFSVELMFVLPSCVAIVTSEGDPSRRDKLWISKGGSFKLAHLPEKVFIMDVKSLPGNDEVEVRLSVEGRDGNRSTMRLLKSDSGDHLSFLDATSELTGDAKGILLKTFQKIEEKENLLQKALNLLKNFFSQESHRTISQQFVTKGSFDGGKTWHNLKVVDPSMKHRHLFKCDIDDVEHCSFQFFSFHEEEPIAGTIMKRGTVGKYYGKGSAKNEMTFISRDGGVSWEVAFEFPVQGEFLDFGNIMVAIRYRQECRGGENEAYTKFFFSMDRGRTWEEYHFDKPILANEVELKVHDAKAYMGFSKFNKESIEYIFYTIDFSNAFDGNACTEDDLERWYSNCIDGMRYSYLRRKPDAKCLMTKTFEKLEVHEEKCV